MQVLFRATHWLRIWSPLQKCDDDTNLLKDACQSLEQRLCKFSPTMDVDLAIGLLLNKFPCELCWCLIFTFVNIMSVFADGGAAV